MVETQMEKAYITYVLNPMISAKLLKERIRHTEIINIDGKILNSRNSIPKKLLQDMIESQHAKITPTETIILEGKDKIFGIPNTRSRTFQMGGTKYVRIRILAKDMATLWDIIAQIKQEMRKYGEEPKVCAWHQTGMVNRTKKVKESPRKKPEFSQREMKEQMLMDLKHTRRNENNGAGI